MSVEQAIHELEEQLQQVFASHQAMRQELTTLRNMFDMRSRIQLVEPKTLMPDLILKQACGLARDTGKPRILTHFTPRPRHPRTHVALVKAQGPHVCWASFFFCERVLAELIGGSVSLVRSP